MEGEKNPNKSACLFSPVTETGGAVLDPHNRIKQESERCVCNVVVDTIKQSLYDV